MLVLFSVDLKPKLRHITNGELVLNLPVAKMRWSECLLFSGRTFSIAFEKVWVGVDLCQVLQPETSWNHSLQSAEQLEPEKETEETIGNHLIQAPKGQPLVQFKAVVLASLQCRANLKRDYLDRTLPCLPCGPTLQMSRARACNGKNICNMCRTVCS